MEKTPEGDDYEIMLFEDFCNKSDKLKNISLPENDNINYRLCYESDLGENSNDKEQKEDSHGLEETSLCNDKKVTWMTKAAGFVPFVRTQHYTDRDDTATQDKTETEKTTNKMPRYERFSEQRNSRNLLQRFCRRPEFYSSLLIIVLLLALSIGMWWMVCWVIGSAWGDAHYRKLWERAHPDDPQRHAPAPPVVPFTHEKILPDVRYHDHNNLSTKNKAMPNQKKSTNNTELFQYRACVITDINNRYDCYPQDEASEDKCMERGCCWDDTVPNHMPYCFFPFGYSPFRFYNASNYAHGMSAYYKNIIPSGYPKDFELVKMDFVYVSPKILQIKITDANENRFEPPFPEVPVVGTSRVEYNFYSVKLSDKGFTVELQDGTTVMDIDEAGPLILSDKFLQLSTLLQPGKYYGLGEMRSRLALNMNWTTYTIFNHDAAPRDNTNLYGSHPFYMSLTNNSQFHGVLLINSHPMDIALQPTPAITYRTIGGILNFFLFFGPSADEVTKQYSEIVGKPFFPPIWGLGFHLCKFNYGSLNVTRRTFYNTVNAGIPIDAQWNDLDYMDNANMFTYDKNLYKELPKFIKELHSQWYQWVPLFDPGMSAAEPKGKYLPFDRGMEMDIFIKNSSSQPFVGKVWNKRSTVWPDFTHPNATSYWTEMMQHLYKSIKFDGAWIDMNEPSNFLSGSMYGECADEALPYKPHTDGHDVGLRYKTLCMDAKHYKGTHLEYHNLYSSMEAVATNFALKEITGKRPFIISRSSFVGLGQYAGHWSGDIDSSWDDMAMTIPDILRFSMFGVPLMGADICGFRGNTTVELCKRWMQLGAFYPFARNHNSDSSIPQDPVSLGKEVVAASREALLLRYTYLPYLYNLFWRAHSKGLTVARPVFFEFPTDSNTHDIDDQFMLGKYLLIVPILKQGASYVRPYLTNLTGWFNLRTGDKVQSGDKLDELSTVLVREGAILMGRVLYPGYCHNQSCNTEMMHPLPMQLLVVMPISEDQEIEEEYYTDDEHNNNNYEEKRYTLKVFHLDVSKRQLFIENKWWGYGMTNLEIIKFYNVVRKMTNITIASNNCVPEHLVKQSNKCWFKQDNTTVIIKHRKLVMLENIRITWLW